MAAKKPLRVYQKTRGRMIPVDPATLARQRTRGIPARPVYAEATNQDQAAITQRVLEYSPTARARMEKEPSPYEGLLHSIYDAVLITDMTGRILDANLRAEHAFMLAREDLREMNFVELVSGADDRLLTVIQRNVDNRRFTIVEAICLRADGTRFFAEIVVNLLRGYPRPALCFFVRDITERKQVEQQLRQVNERLVDAEKIQARLDTMSTLVHAINNPLQILMCMAELDQNEEYKKQVDRIVDVINKLRQTESFEVVPDQEVGARYDLDHTAAWLPCDRSRLLVVDDERLLRDMFTKALMSAFPELMIDAVADGRQAIEAFEKHRPAVIVMDVSMPMMSGEEAFKQIRALCEQKRWALPCFIFCTGFVISEPLQQIVGNQQYHLCLTKPVEMADLIRTIQARLSESFATPRPPTGG